MKDLSSHLFLHLHFAYAYKEGRVLYARVCAPEILETFPHGFEADRSAPAIILFQCRNDVHNLPMRCELRGGEIIKYTDRIPDSSPFREHAEIIIGNDVRGAAEGVCKNTPVGISIRGNTDTVWSMEGEYGDRLDAVTKAIEKIAEMELAVKDIFTGEPIIR